MMPILRTDGASAGRDSRPKGQDKSGEDNENEQVQEEEKWCKRWRQTTVSTMVVAARVELAMVARSSS